MKNPGIHNPGHSDVWHAGAMSSPSLTRPQKVSCDHLQHAWNRALVERLDPHISVERERRIFDLVLLCDPTPTGKYMNWLSRWRRQQWPDFGLRHMCSNIELRRVGRGLEHFHQVRRSLAPELRDIGRFQTASQLLELEEGAKVVSRSDRRALERAEAHSETTVLYDAGCWKLVRLEGPRAAEWWGRGTRWCTQSRYAFENWASQGELYVLLTPFAKYQFILPGLDCRDASDCKADIHSAARNAPHELGAAIGLLVSHAS